MLTEGTDKIVRVTEKDGDEDTTLIGCVGLRVTMQTNPMMHGRANGDSILAMQ